MHQNSTFCVTIYMGNSILFKLIGNNFHNDGLSTIIYESPTGIWALYVNLPKTNSISFFKWQFQWMSKWLYVSIYCGGNSYSISKEREKVRWIKKIRQTKDYLTIEWPYRMRNLISKTLSLYLCKKLGSYG